MSAGLNEREYNIILHKGVDYGEFFNSLVDITNKDGIPNRKAVSYTHLTLPTTPYV